MEELYNLDDRKKRGENKERKDVLSWQLFVIEYGNINLNKVSGWKENGALTFNAWWIISKSMVIAGVRQGEHNLYLTWMSR